MDNQEAIRLMRNLPTMCEFTDAYGEPIDSDAYYEAVDIAISALHAQDAPDTNVGTMISRQAAIDEAEEWIETYNSGRGGQRERDAIKHVISGIKKLPSAQPDGIPLEWIDKHLEWLDNCDNDFAQLAKVGIRAMVEIWKKDKT